MYLDRVYYCCDICKKEMHAYVRDMGFYPMWVKCDECEGTAILKFNPVAIEPSFKLISPNTYEREKHRKVEEERFMKLGFSKIECVYLFEHEINWINKSGLILIKI